MLVGPGSCTLRFLVLSAPTQSSGGSSGRRDFDIGFFEVSICMATIVNVPTRHFKNGRIVTFLDPIFCCVGPFGPTLVKGEPQTHSPRSIEKRDPYSSTRCRDNFTMEVP